ncbi:hypothetical protein ACHAXA_008850 [Cyclostephanos tholiformis]|uniref:Uncharacterized protein n=1 Tax=Cyclostephanos tholiformis TaxID=382380 RepID=A0ABD3SFN2_9STRA
MDASIADGRRAQGRPRGRPRAKKDCNPLLTAQQRFLDSLSPQTIRGHFFSPTHVTPERRAEIWEEQADLGETLVNIYAWATPDPRLLRVFQHFGPIVEVGCGANAYWSRWMNSTGGVDVVALDACLEEGGKFSADRRMDKKLKKIEANDGVIRAHKLLIRKGGPATLSEDAEIRDSGRALFLCYPDEEDYQQDDNDDEDNDEAAPPMSMAAACLEHYTGSIIIHVGELYGDTLSLEQAPFGRSSSSEFSQRLASEYHCILKMNLQSNWLHVRDTLSVWKRSKTCCMAFQDDDDESDGSKNGSYGDMYYKYIPPEEVLPIDCAAPCVAHLLVKCDDTERGAASGDAYFKSPNVDEGSATSDGKFDHRNRVKKKKRKKNTVGLGIAGNAW